MVSPSAFIRPADRRNSGGWSADRFATYVVHGRLKPDTTGNTTAVQRFGCSPSKCSRTSRAPSRRPGSGSGRPRGRSFENEVRDALSRVTNRRRLCGIDLCVAVRANAAGHARRLDHRHSHTCLGKQQRHRSPVTPPPDRNIHYELAATDWIFTSGDQAKQWSRRASWRNFAMSVVGSVQLCHISEASWLPACFG